MRSGRTLSGFESQRHNSIDDLGTVMQRAILRMFGIGSIALMAVTLMVVMFSEPNMATGMTLLYYNLINTAIWFVIAALSRTSISTYWVFR